MTCDPCRDSAEPIPTVLFHGEAVWSELNDKERTRTTEINVSDVLDAVVRLMRREARQKRRAHKTLVRVEKYLRL